MFCGIIFRVDSGYLVPGNNKLPNKVWFRIGVIENCGMKDKPGSFMKKEKDYSKR